MSGSLTDLRGQCGLPLCERTGTDLGLGFVVSGIGSSTVGCLPLDELGFEELGLDGVALGGGVGLAGAGYLGVVLVRAMGTVRGGEVGGEGEGVKVVS